MTEPILKPSYWAARLRAAERAGELHRSVFLCPAEKWARIEDRHREIIAANVAPSASVLDCGCGYGRLLRLMPPDWVGAYLGVDLSPDLLALARSSFSQRTFAEGDLRTFESGGYYDWAVLISIRPMIKRNLGGDVWAETERNVRRNAARLLYLEYEEDDPGSIE